MSKVFLRDYISTTPLGYQYLVNFYYECLKFKDCKIEIDLGSLNWIDANLCGLWLAMLDDLKEQNKLSFYIEQKYWLENSTKYPNNFHILFRNQFISLLNDMGNIFEDCKDARKSSITLKSFTIAEVDKFVEYVEEEFLNHRGCQISVNDKNILQTAYLELFSNYEIHAKTTKPIYVCGQYFPKNQQLMFSLTDVGIGFIKPIYEYTQTMAIPIATPQKAIEWALEGKHTTKKLCLGGSGLKSIDDYCRSKHGNFHIITDGVYTYLDTNQKRIFNMLPTHFKGVTIHLIV